MSALIAAGNPMEGGNGMMHNGNGGPGSPNGFYNGNGAPGIPQNMMHHGGGHPNHGGDFGPPPPSPFHQPHFAIPTAPFFPGHFDRMMAAAAQQGHHHHMAPPPPGMVGPGAGGHHGLHTQVTASAPVFAPAYCQTVVVTEPTSCPQVTNAGPVNASLIDMAAMSNAMSNLTMQDSPPANY